MRVRTYLWTWAIVSASGFGNPQWKVAPADLAIIVNLRRESDTQADKTLAARRIKRALDYLDDERLITRPGRDVIRLLDPSGNGATYRPWTAEEMKARDRARDRLHRDFGVRYDQRRTPVWEGQPLELPVQLWTSGLLSRLPATAAVVLVVLLRHLWQEGAPVVLTKSRAFEHPIAKGSWYKGLAELEAVHIIKRQPGRLLFVGDNANPKFDEDRYRNHWTIDLSGIEQPPTAAAKAWPG